MKQKVLRWLRFTGLLGFADQMHYYYHRIISAPGNKQFCLQNPTFSIPPARLAFETYGHTNWLEYDLAGKIHADVISGYLKKKLDQKPARILEWGCGAGRILRHTVKNQDWTVIGVDIDAEAVQWCHHHLPDLEVQLSDFKPPLPFADSSLDAIYHFSVWTHLSQDLIELWVKEFARILKPGGVMVATTHGDAYLKMLMPKERSLYQQGQIVSRGEVTEGGKYFLSFHPSQKMSQLLETYFSDVTHIPATPQSDFPQDVWLVKR